LELGFVLKDGLELGFELGFLLVDGLELGLELGLPDGLELGLRLGLPDGLELGFKLGLPDGLELGSLEGLAVGDLLGVAVLGFPDVGWLVGEFVVTVTDMVTFKVAAPAVVFRLLKYGSSVSLETAVLLAEAASWYSFLRASAKLPSADALVNLFFTKSSNWVVICWVVQLTLQTSLRITSKNTVKTWPVIVALMIFTFSNVWLLLNWARINTLIASLKTSSNALETLLSWRSTRVPVETGWEYVPRTPTVMVGVTVGVEVGLEVGNMVGNDVGLFVGGFVGDIVGALRSPLMQAPLIWFE
jgi:hypothetical protein